LNGTHFAAARTRHYHVFHNQGRFQQARHRVAVIAPRHNSCRLACGFRPHDRVKDGPSDGKIQETAQEGRVGKGGDPKETAALMLNPVEDRMGGDTNAKQVHQADPDALS